MALASVDLVARLLQGVGYGPSQLRTEYPVWLGRELGTLRADLVAFARPETVDMSTATITYGYGDYDLVHRFARALASPYFLIERDRGLELWIASLSEPRR